ncbi:unnamed protein product [Colias eurytheme]|nr:unnamed protein product [Colias eurytheme]
MWFLLACYSLNVHKILLALECEDDNQTAENLIYVEPPVERSDQATDEDNDKLFFHKDLVKQIAEVIDYLIRQYEHPVDIFLASLPPTLKELHPCDLFDAKSEMFAIVQKYESKLLKNKFPRLAHESSIITSQNRSNVSNYETVVFEDHGSANTSHDRSNAINYETTVVEDHGSVNTCQDRSKTVVMENHASTITNQERSKVISNYETVLVKYHGNAITSQDRSNAV